jgi:hypothetical protein
MAKSRLLFPSFIAVTTAQKVEAAENTSNDPAGDWWRS